MSAPGRNPSGTRKSGASNRTASHLPVFFFIFYTPLSVYAGICRMYFAVCADDGQKDGKNKKENLCFFGKSLDKQKAICYNRHCATDSCRAQSIAASPSGKATDSDSVITQVRILVPQPTVLTLIDAGRINPEPTRVLGFFSPRIQVENKQMPMGVFEGCQGFELLRTDFQGRF